MENAVEAIKIAFAVFVFTMALSLSMVMFTQAKQTSDVVLKASDVTEYMEYIESSSDSIGSRVVGLETIIPTLYNYYRENYTVIFVDSNYDFMPIYETQTYSGYWSSGYYNKYFGGTDTRICSFDANEEQRRREPWTTSGTSGNTIDYYIKQNLDAFLSGGIFESPSGDGTTYNYSSRSINGWGTTRSFIEQFKDSEFDEYLGWYITSDTSEDGNSGEYITSNFSQIQVTQSTKRVIVYRLRP